LAAWATISKRSLPSEKPELQPAQHCCALCELEANEWCEVEQAIPLGVFEKLMRRTLCGEVVACDPIIDLTIEKKRPGSTRGRYNTSYIDHETGGRWF
jgi:hypothetical protein